MDYPAAPEDDQYDEEHQVHYQYGAGYHVPPRGATVGDPFQRSLLQRRVQSQQQVLAAESPSPPRRQPHHNPLRSLPMPSKDKVMNAAPHGPAQSKSKQHKSNLSAARAAALAISAPSQRAPRAPGALRSSVSVAKELISSVENEDVDDVDASEDEDAPMRVRKGSTNAKPGLPRRLNLQPGGPVPAAMSAGEDVSEFDENDAGAHGNGSDDDEDGNAPPALTDITRGLMPKRADKAAGDAYETPKKRRRSNLKQGTLSYRLASVQARMQSVASFLEHLTSKVAIPCGSPEASPRNYSNKHSSSNNTRRMSELIAVHDVACYPSVTILVCSLAEDGGKPMVLLLPTALNTQDLCRGSTIRVFAPWVGANCGLPRPSEATGGEQNRDTLIVLGGFEKVHATVPASMSQPTAGRPHPPTPSPIKIATLAQAQGVPDVDYTNVTPIEDLESCADQFVSVRGVVCGVYHRTGRGPQSPYPSILVASEGCACELFIPPGMAAEGALAEVLSGGRGSTIRIGRAWVSRRSQLAVCAAPMSSSLQTHLRHNHGTTVLTSVALIVCTPAGVVLGPGRDLYPEGLSIAGTAAAGTRMNIPGKIFATFYCPQRHSDTAFIFAGARLENGAAIVMRISLSSALFSSFGDAWKALTSANSIVVFGGLSYQGIVEECYQAELDDYSSLTMPDAPSIGKETIRNVAGLACPRLQSLGDNISEPMAVEGMGVAQMPGVPRPALCFVCGNMMEDAIGVPTPAWLCITCGCLYMTFSCEGRHLCVRLHNDVLLSQKVLLGINSIAQVPSRIIGSTFAMAGVIEPKVETTISDRLFHCTTLLKR